LTKEWNGLKKKKRDSEDKWFGGQIKGGEVGNDFESVEMESSDKAAIGEIWL
jgi:hypothetical protein